MVNTLTNRLAMVTIRVLWDLEAGLLKNSNFAGEITSELIAIYNLEHSTVQLHLWGYRCSRVLWREVVDL